MINHKITLEVLTPVFIGSGNSITKKDFSLEGKEVNVYNPIKLHKLFKRDYEDFLTNHFNLTDFLQRSSHRRDIDLTKALKYSVELGDFSIRKSDRILEFIKDPYGMAYVPGSCLKGAIRTAALAYEISKNKNKYSTFAREKLDQHESNRDIEKIAFGEFQNSVFRNIRISDSKPIDNSNLIISKKVDVFKDGNTNNKLNICRESLKPGTKIEFTLTIDNSSKNQYYEADYLLEAINFFGEQYKSRYLSKFAGYKDIYGENILYLGGGTGFPTKTINYSLYGDKATEQISDFLANKFKKHNHDKDKVIGISPRAKKCTLINRNTVEMGITKIRID